MKLLRERQFQRFMAIVLLSSLWFSLEILPLVNWGGFSSSPIVLDKDKDSGQDGSPCAADAAGLQSFQQIQNVSLLRDVFLNYSKGAAEWLISQAKPSDAGYCWNHSSGSGTAPDNNNYTFEGEGAAGVGSYLLDIFASTGNQTYLQYAEGAAQWLMARAFSKNGGYYWWGSDTINVNYTGAYFGAAGIGEFFIKVFRATGNLTYLDYALGAAIWLNGTKVEENGGYKFPNAESDLTYYTGRKFGAAGIANFFLELFDCTGNTTFWDLANRTLIWLVSVVNQNSGGYRWLVSTSNYNCGQDWGAAGIGTTFLRAFQHSGNATFLSYAKGAATWLDGTKDIAGGGYCWRNNQFTGSYYLDYSEGAAGIGQFLLDMFQATGNQTYLSLAQGAAQWIVSQTNTMSPGYRWPQITTGNVFYTGLSLGTAGIALFLKDLYEGTGNTTFLHYARGGAEWLVSNATAIGGGFCWNYSINSPPTSYTLPTGLRHGAAGIGQFFAELAQASWTNGSISIVGGAADWLISYAYMNPVIGGYQWHPYAEPVGGANYTGQYSGAAGIGDFFLDAFERSGNSTYLDYAKGAADWLIYQAKSRNSGFAWEQTTSTGTLYTGQDYGAAGIGQFFLRIFRTTGNLTYLGTAKNASQWLISNATARDGGFSWQIANTVNVHYTGYRAGAAGIGSFLLDAFACTGNQTYLDYAKGAAEWLVSNATASKGGWCWRQCTSTNVNYTGYEDGAAGIGDFLYKAFQATGNVSYRNYANGAARWLIGMAVENGTGLQWPNKDEASYSNNTNYASGAAGIGAFFLNAFAATRNVTYLNVAEKAANWLQTAAQDSGNGACWINYYFGTPLNRTGFWSGNAGIGHFFQQAYLHTGNQSYLHYSRLAAQWLVSMIDTSESGYRWIECQDQSPTPYYATGVETGAAGIGSFFASGIDLDLLPPTIGTPTPGTPVVNQDVNVSVSVTDDYAVDSVILNWNSNVFPMGANVTMVRTSGNLWNGTIPGQPEGSTVNYIIYANDSMGHLALLDGGGFPFSYNFPAVPPVIQTPNVGIVFANTNVTVNVSVTDNVAVHTVILSWDNNTGYGWNNVTMAWLSGTIYTGNVTGHPEGTNISLQFYANDTANNWGINNSGGQYFNYTVPYLQIYDPEVGIITPFTDICVNISVTTNLIPPDGVDTVILSWSNNSGTTWTNLTMTNITGGKHQTNVPGHPEGSEIQYQFYANDTLNHWAKNDNEGIYFSYNIPAIAPIISTPKIGRIAVSDPVTINVSVTDNHAVSTVILSWSDDDGATWQNVTMILISGSTYEGSVNGRASGTVIKYKLYANDTSNLWAVNDKGGALFSYTVPAPSSEFPWLWIVIIGGAILAIALVVVPQVRGKTKASKKKRFVSEALFPTPAVALQKGQPAPAPSPALLAAIPLAEEFEEKETAPGIYTYRGGRIVGPRFIYKVKVKNTTDFIIADVTIHLASYPRECMTLATEEIRHVPKIEPHGFRSLEFELVPQKDCVEGSLISTVNYVDHKNELRTLTVQPFTLKSVCDLMEPLALPEPAFDSLVKSWARTQEIVTFKGENVRAMIEDVPAIFESKNFHSVAQKIKEDGDNILAEIKGVAVGKYTKRKMALIVQVQANAKKGEGEISCVGLAEDPSMLAACLGEVLVEFRKPLVRQVRRVLKERKGLCEVEVLRQTLKVELPVLADAVRQEKDLTFLQSGDAVATYDYIAGFVNDMRKDYDSLPIHELEKELKPLGKPMRTVMQDLMASGKVKAAWVNADEFRFKAETHKLIFSVLRYAVAIISGLITIILAIQSVIPK